MGGVRWVGDGVFLSEAVEPQMALNVLRRWDVVSAFFQKTVGLTSNETQSGRGRKGDRGEWF